MPKSNESTVGTRRRKRVARKTDVYLDQAVQQDLLNRLSRLEGHVRGVRRMLQEHQSCDDLLIQISAVRAAINQVGAILLENHLETCVAACIRNGTGDLELAGLKAALAQAFRG
jgi:DNA-binding FrmR family transcriptional regulator